MRQVFVTLSMVALACGAALAKEPVITPSDVPVLGELDPWLIKTLYRSPNAEAGLKELQTDPEFGRLIKKHKLLLFGGPMLGRVTPESASVWLRTSRPSEVELRVFPVDADGTGEDSSQVANATSQTSEKGDFTTILDVAGLQPFTEYRYDVLVNGVSSLPKPLPVFRTHPKSDQQVKFSIGFGGGARYLSEKEFIWAEIAKQKPQAFLFLGDNIYIDEPEWRNRQRAMYYRRQLRPEYQRLTSQTACYAIWDDHDFGKNDTSGGPEIFKPEWKYPAWKVFRENWVNPAYGGGPKQPGCWHKFSVGDVDVFMTDGRYYRSFKDGTMLGPVQKAWLLKSLKESNARFKILASGTLWTEQADKGGADSWWGVKEEREEIFSLIDEHQIPGVILVSADRHRCDIYRIRRPNGYDLYEFESSKLTNDHTHKTKPGAVFSYNKGNFYSLLRFDLTKDDPTVTSECISNTGELIHSYTLKLSQLEAKAEPSAE